MCVGVCAYNIIAYKHIQVYTVHVLPACNVPHHSSYSVSQQGPHCSRVDYHLSQTLSSGWWAADLVPYPASNGALKPCSEESSWLVQVVTFVESASHTLALEDVGSILYKYRPLQN